MNRRYRV